MEKNRWSILFVISTFVIAIGYLIFSGKAQEVIQQINHLNPVFLLLGIVAIFAYWMTEAKITNDMVRSTGNLQPYNKALEVTMIGQFFNGITPFSSGGQPAQLYYLAKQKLSIGKGSSVLMSKFIIYQGTLVIYSIFFLMIRAKYFVGLVNNIFYLVMIGFTVNLLVIGALIYFSFAKKSNRSILTKMIRLIHKIKIIKNPEKEIEKCYKHIDDFHDQIILIKSNKKLFVRSVTLSFVQLTFYFIIPYFIYRSFDLEGADLVSMIAGTGFVLMVTSFIPIPGASGGAEGGFVLILGLFFISKYVMTAIILWRLITYYLGMFIGGVWMIFARMSVD